MDDLFADDPPFKLHRKDAPTTSVEAAKDISSGELKALVFRLIKKSADEGITTKEIRALYPTLAYSSITARPASLEQEGKLYYLGDKRDGCRVMREKTEHSPKYTICPRCNVLLMEFYNKECQVCK